MKPKPSNPIVNAYQAGSSVESAVDALDSSDSAFSEILEQAWKQIRKSKDVAGSRRRDDALEVIRAALQSAEEQEDTGGLACCPFCLYRCLWGEDDHCKHYVGVAGSELQEQDLLVGCDSALADRWCTAWGAAEGIDPPARILPDVVSEQLGSTSMEGLIALVIHCGAVPVDSTADDGGQMQMIFAKSLDAFERKLGVWIERFGEWADKIEDCESD